MNQIRLLTPKEIKDGCIIISKNGEDDVRLCVINEEFRQTFDFLNQFPKSVTFFGSARFMPEHQYYQKAKDIAEKIARELGYAIITGGGPGIMQAGNEGAVTGGSDSVGMTIALPHEQTTNKFVKKELQFYYFFSRKVALSYSAEAYIYFPGGFGTLDEFFEILTLIQTHKIPKAPIILVGNDFWRPLDNYIKSVLKNDFKTISPEDTDLYTITENEEEIIKIVRSAPIRPKAD